jgi:hypothetical protein
VEEGTGSKNEPVFKDIVGHLTDASCALHLVHVNGMDAEPFWVCRGAFFELHPLPST